MPWSFADYVSRTGREPIRKWFDALPPGARAKVDDRLLAMASMDRWPEKWASTYQGAEKIIELRIKGPDNVQYRPLGMRHPTRQQCFVLLHGAIEKGRIPRDDIDTAQRRRDEILAEPERIVPHV